MLTSADSSLVLTFPSFSKPTSSSSLSSASSCKPKAAWEAAADSLGLKLSVRLIDVEKAENPAEIRCEMVDDSKGSSGSGSSAFSTSSAADGLSAPLRAVLVFFKGTALGFPRNLCGVVAVASLLGSLSSSSV